MTVRALLFKAFPGHAGRPGQIGGSAPRAIAGGGGGGGASPSGSVPIVSISGDEISGDTVAELRDSAASWLRQKMPKFVENPRLGMKIFISVTGVKKTLSHGSHADQAHAIAALPALLSVGVPYRKNADRFGRRDILAWHYLVAPLTVGDRAYVARMAVRETTHRTVFYDQILVKLLPIGKVGATEVGSPSFKQGSASAATVDIGTMIAAVKVVDSRDMAKAIPPGSRWITVHPNGPAEKGQPLLIQPAGDGAFKVIGGAGGKLNHLRMTGVRSEGDYATEVRSKQAGRREEKKRQREQDKKDGLTASKARAREALKAEVGDHEAKFIKQVAQTLGWSDDEMRFPAEKYQNASEGALTKARSMHARMLSKRAQEAVDHQRRRLLEDAQARGAADMGEVPIISAKPDQISVQDLDPVEPSTKGFGYSPDYKGRSEKAGLTPAVLQKEAAAAKPSGVDTPAKVEAAESRKVTTDAIAAELKAIRDPGPQVDPRAKVEAKQAIDLLKAEKELRAVRQQARQKASMIDGAKEKPEPKAFALETVSKPVDADIRRQADGFWPLATDMHR